MVSQLVPSTLHVCRHSGFLTNAKQELSSPSNLGYVPALEPCLSPGIDTSVKNSLRAWQLQDTHSSLVHFLAGSLSEASVVFF